MFEEVLCLRAPPGLFLCFDHLATIYVLSSSSGGKIRLTDIIQLAAFATTHQKTYPTYEIMSHMQGFCMLALWRDLREGSDKVRDWLVELVKYNRPIRTAQGRKYVSSASIFPLFQCLRQFLPQQQGFQGMFDLMQEAAEDLGLLSLDDSSMDDFVPLQLVNIVYNPSIKIYSYICTR